MIKNGFIRFCNDPETACCKAEAEQEKGCEYCNNTDYIFESQQKIETTQWDEYEDGFIVIRQHIKFCPMCGKKLEAHDDQA